MPDKNRTFRDRRPSNNTEYGFHSNDKKPKDSHIQWPDYFEVDGKKYNNEGILSDSSKEAITFTVTSDGRKYALKIYRYDPDHRPDHDVLEKIHLLRDSGLLVPIISHGQLSTPNFPGRKNDYQLMDFCEGGCLDDVFIKGDEKELAEVAGKIGAAIDFLSRRGIMSIDVMPANFYYFDRERTQIVLSGFAGSGECHPGGYINVDELCSVYMAPEFYTKVSGEHPEIRVESYYFSLGMSLLSLWMGKKWCKSNERQLFRSKLDETLPMPKDMPTQMQSLIKSLTRLKLSERAGYNDIKRWIRGEELGSDTLPTINSDFHIDFNSTKGQVAHSPAELSHYLLADKTLGMNYLYTGRITKWLEETNRKDIAVNVEKTVKVLYPENREAGLLAVAYMLDPTMGYVTPGGVCLTEPRDVARYAYENPGEMKEEFLGDDTRLMIFLKVHNLENTLKQSVDIYTNRPDNARDDAYAYIAIYNFAKMFHDLPLPVYLHEHFEYAETIDDLFKLIGSEGYISDINKAIIHSPGFILLLSFRNPVLADKIRKLIASDTDDVKSIYYNSSSAYRILFELDPEVDLKFNNDVNSPNRVSTISEIGKDLEHLLIGMQTAEKDTASHIGIFLDLDNTPYGDYLRARGETYLNILAWNRNCMNADDMDIENKVGPYDIVIGIYKSVSGFLGHPPCYSLLGSLIDSPDKLNEFPIPVVTEALGDKDRTISSLDGKPLPWLAAWLTVFFQENPKLKLNQKSTYESETVKYTEFIASLASDYSYADRYRKAEKIINKSGTSYERRVRIINNRKTFFCILAGLPTLALMVLSWFFERPDYCLIDWHPWIVFLPCLLAEEIPNILNHHSYSAIKSYVIWWMKRLLHAFVLGCFILIGSVFFPTTLTHAGVAALILLALKYGVKILSIKNMVDPHGKVTSADTSEFRYMEALYFAYKDKEKNADTALNEYFHSQIPLDKDIYAKINRYGWLWLSYVLFICVIWVILHVRF